MHLVMTWLIFGIIPSLRRWTEKEETCYMGPNPDQHKTTSWRSRYRRKAQGESFWGRMPAGAMTGFQGPNSVISIGLFTACSINQASPNSGNPQNSLTLANPHPSRDLSFYRVSWARSLEILHIFGLRKTGLGQRSCWNSRTKHGGVSYPESQHFTAALLSCPIIAQCLIQKSGPIDTPNIWEHSPL